ncbi:MAG TPA: MarR family transcriptional regulator [Candidatus Sphingobacterium stercorigallinarum]|nr:MarR family transcriptional regulator [Candidatus Sphingobacterium stercorigallinarum]
MDSSEKTVSVRKLSQQYAYATLKFHERVGRKMGLGGTDHKYLGFLIQKERMTAGELAALTGLTTGAVTGLVDRLERKSLVRRQRDKTDRRKIIIVADVNKIIKLITPFYQEFQNDTDLLFSSFDLPQLAILEKYFKEALRITEKRTTYLENKQEHEYH